MNGNGSYTSAPGFTPTLPGTYRWRASYSGDANNAPVSAACNAPNENANITQERAVPEIATTASAGGPLGTALTDTATLSGGTTPTGSIIFRLYGPNDATCANPAIFTSNAIAVNGNGSYTSAPPFTPTAPGTYRWRAFYTGDEVNNGGHHAVQRAERERRHHADDGDVLHHGLGRRPARHDADRHGDVVGRYGTDRHHHVRAVRPERCHLRESLRSSRRIRLR